MSEHRPAAPPDGEPTPTMVASMSLDGDVDRLAAHYAQWAETYDADVTSERYALPATIVEVLASAEIVLGTERPTERLVLDAGCGTGLVGVELARAGYRNLAGVDLSDEMIARAAARGVYALLEGGVDLTKPLSPDLRGCADVTVVAGVFTVGHVPPSSLAIVADTVRPDGLLITSTRAAYYESTDYQAVSDRLIADGRLELVHRLEDGPYTMDSTAHYWAYRVIERGGP